MSVHAYKFNKDTSTFIVEMREEDWLKAGIDKMEQEEAIAFCQEVFKDHLDGNDLISNAKHLRGSANWIKFPRIICNNWHTYAKNQDKKIPIVLMGDSCHTAHFSIGSGTKLALESAIALAEKLTTEENTSNAFAKYEEERKLEVFRLQSAARNSVEWFEDVERYLDLDPVQLNYSLLTRSQRISHENLRERDPSWLKSAEQWFQDQAAALQ